MYGVVLAGGQGTRLGELTKDTPKALIEVAGRPQIDYPLGILEAMGCDTAVIVSSPEGREQLEDSLGESRRGMELRYATQPEPNGTADALLHANIFDGEPFPVLCGDVYFDSPLPSVDRPTLFYSEFDGAHNHTVWDPNTNRLVEKPEAKAGQLAIVGYVFDQRVFGVIPGLAPSARGEIELLDVYRYYLENGVEMQEYRGTFVDMGTPDGISKVEDLEAARA